jgi:hypothetical protein
VGGPSTKVLGPPPPLSELTGDTKQRKGVIQHRAHLAGSSSTVVLGANRPQTARTLSGTVVRGGGGGEGAALIICVGLQAEIVDGEHLPMGKIV